MKKVLLIGFLICFAMACGDDGGGGSEVDSALSSVNSTYSDFATTICGCYADQTHNGDQAACIEDNKSTLAVNSCEREAAECYEYSFTTTIDCIRNATSDYAGCLSSCPTDQASFDTCEQQYNQEVSSCNFSAELSQALQGCENGQTFTCGT